MSDDTDVGRCFHFLHFQSLYARTGFFPWLDDNEPGRGAGRDQGAGEQFRRQRVLVVESGVGNAAAERVDPADLVRTRYRQPLTSAIGCLSCVAAAQAGNKAEEPE